MRDITNDETRLKRFQPRTEGTARSAFQRRRSQPPTTRRHGLPAPGSARPQRQRRHPFQPCRSRPARGSDTITVRVIEHLTTGQQLALTKLAPPALLSERYGLIGADNGSRRAAQTAQLLLPPAPPPQTRQPRRAQRLPRPRCRQRHFGLASGATWYAPDAVRRFTPTSTPQRSSSNSAPG